MCGAIGMLRSLVTMMWYTCLLRWYSLQLGLSFASRATTSLIVVAFPRSRSYPELDGSPLCEDPPPLLVVDPRVEPFTEPPAFEPALEDRAFFLRLANDDPFVFRPVTKEPKSEAP